mgnify:CR=1 FL=1
MTERKKNYESQQKESRKGRIENSISKIQNLILDSFFEFWENRKKAIAKDCEREHEKDETIVFEIE